MLQITLVAITVGIIVSVVHTYFGLYIIRRGIIFVDLALAQAAALGLAISSVIFHNYTHNLFYQYGLSFLTVLIVTILLTIATNQNIINTEALIGIIYVGLIAMTFIVLSNSSAEFNEIHSLLSGDILLVSPKQLLITIIVYLFFGLIHLIFGKRMWDLSTNWTLLFFITFGITLIFSVQMVGVFLAFSYLIIPAVVAVIFTKDYLSVSSLIVGSLVGTLGTVVGTILSVFWNFPTSPTIIITLITILILSILANSFIALKRKS